MQFRADYFGKCRTQAKLKLFDSPLSLTENLREKLGFVRGVCFAKGWELPDLLDILIDELDKIRR